MERGEAPHYIHDRQGLARRQGQGVPLQPDGVMVAECELGGAGALLKFWGPVGH